MGKMVVLIVKVVAAVILFIALVVGGEAHANSDWTDGGKEWRRLCEDINDGKKAVKKAGVDVDGAPPHCPSESIGMELTFIIINAILLIVSIVMIIVPLVAGQRMKTCDGGYSAVAGILIIITGILMITSAVLIDNFLRYLAHINPIIEDERIKKGRESAKFFNKLAAGALAIIDGIIYIVLCCLICSSRSD